MSWLGRGIALFAFAGLSTGAGRDVSASVEQSASSARSDTARTREALAVATQASGAKSAPASASRPARTGKAPPGATTQTPVLVLPEELVSTTGVQFDRRGGFSVQISGREAHKLAGAFSDPTRYVQTLPGVTSDSDFDGLLLVRGGEAGHNRILLDQTAVSDPYHFGSVVSFMNADVIDRVAFVPGGFGADQGDAIGGLLEIDRRVGNLNGFRAGASLTSIAASAVAEGPIGSGGTTSWILSARRSHLDLVLKGRSLGHATLPYYYDLDARLYHRTGRAEWKLGYLRSGDELSAQMSDEFTFAPPDSAGLSWGRQLDLVNLGWRLPVENWALSQSASYTWRDQSLVLHGDLPQYAQGVTRTFDWRGDATQTAGSRRWSSGLQVIHNHTDYALDVNQLSLEQTDRRSSPRTPLDTTYVQTAFEGRDLYTAGYVQAEQELWDGAVTALLGGRVEHTVRTGEVSVTPRARLEWNTPLGLTLFGSAGTYRQFPGLRIEADPTIGNAALQPERAAHFSAGAVLPVAAGGRISVSGYHKNLSELIALDADAPEGTPRYQNTGTGTARGLEFLVHVPQRRWSAWISYTLGDVVYRDAPDLQSYAPSQDVRHAIAAVGKVSPWDGWVFGLKFRAQSGRPYTPITGRENVSEFVDGLEWIPVTGAYNGARFPWYHRLDVRAERQFRLGNTQLGAFLEVINLYDRKNLFDYRYEDDYGRATPVQMMPLLPTFGLSVSL
jgi:hypothetical protein